MHNTGEQSYEQDRQSYQLALIVDDDPDIAAFLLEVMAQETQYRAISVSNAFSALQAVIKYRPHLIILDYQLPDMDGLTLYDRLLQIRALDGATVMMLSANLPVDGVARRKIIGMSKPLDLELFLKAVQNIFVSYRKNEKRQEKGRS